MISLFNFPFIQLKYPQDRMFSIQLEASNFLGKYETESPIGWRSKSKGSFKDPYMNVLRHGNEVSEIKGAINTFMGQAFQELRMNPENLAIADSWLNRYKQGDNQEVHSHVPYSMSAIFYIQVPKDSEASILFYNPYRNSIVNPTPYDAPLLDLPIEEGLFLLFPSYVDHAVPVYRGYKDKISLALNFVYQEV